MARLDQASREQGPHQDYRVVAEPRAMVIMGPPDEVSTIVETEVLGTRRPHSGHDCFREECPRA
jgi:hypothetical protein